MSDGTPPFQYRITKYDPARRDALGRYLVDEWTDYSCVGGSFGGVVLTRAAYERMEDAYVRAALALVEEAGVAELAVTTLEMRGASPALGFALVEGAGYAGAELSALLRCCLRAELWCRFEAPGAFVHVGYDYYLYVGVSRPCPLWIAAARRDALYVEECASPYA